jgi:hypothetical protein
MASRWGSNDMLSTVSMPFEMQLVLTLTSCILLYRRRKGKIRCTVLYTEHEVKALQLPHRF